VRGVSRGTCARPSSARVTVESNDLDCGAGPGCPIQSIDFRAIASNGRRSRHGGNVVRDALSRSRYMYAAAYLSHAAIRIRETRSRRGTLFVPPAVTDFSFYFVRVALPCAPRPPPAPRSHRGHPGRVEKKHYKVARCQLAPLRVARRRRTLHAQTTLHECTCPPPRARSPRRPYRARKTKRGGATPHSRSSHTHRHTVDAQKEPCAAYSGRTRSDDGSPFFVAYFWALVRHALVQARACHPWSKLKAQPLHLPSAVASRPAS
jgi:hypothetical protein